MAKKDVASIDYFGDNERFADLFNVYYFAGEQMIKPEDVHERNRSNSLTQRKDNDTPKSEITKSVVVSRDIVREIGTWETAVVIATEAQSDIHYAMPVRVMTGDSANYHSQWQELRKEHKKKKDLDGAEYISGFAKDDRLVPITTTVLYLGEDEWDGPRCLKDILNLDGLPQTLRDRIADYPLHILEVRKFPDYEKFRTDLQWVFGFLQRDQDDMELEKYVAEHRDAFSDLPVDAYDMICQFSHSEVLGDTTDDYKTGKGNVNMCKALDDMLSKREAKGELKGKIQGIVAMCQEFGVSMEVAMEKIMKECGLSEDTARDYIQKYWVEN